jgi:hypothetical protein
MKTLFASALAFTAAAVLAAPLSAQLPQTPRALGAGHGYLGMARGHSAVFLNPANLGLRDNPWWSMAFPQFGFGSTVAGASIGDFQDWRQTTNLTEARRQELLAAVPDEGGEIAFDMKLPVFVYQNRGFGVGVSYNMIGEHSVGRDLVDLLLNQYQQGRTDYSVGNTAGRRATYVDVAAAYGRRFGPLSVGIAGHYYRGISLMQSRMFEPRFNLHAQDIEVDYVGVLSRSGQGYGVDLGVALQPIPMLTLSAAVANIASSMTWSEDLRYRHATFTSADFNVREPIQLISRYEQTEQDLTDAGTPQIRRTAEGLYDDAFFPATLRAGAAIELPTRTKVGLAYSANLTEGRLAGRWDRMLGAGVEQRLPLVTVRAGYTSNLEESSMLTGGLSLGVLEVGVARISDGSYFGTPREGYIGTFGVNVQTRTLRP